MDKTRIAVIGLGGVAQVVHLPLLTKMRDVRITGVADKDNNKLKNISEKYNISNRFKDYRELLQHDDADAVIIATPTNTHHKIAIDCLNAGKHILIEKPAALNSHEAIEIEKAALKNEKSAMVGMNLRFRPDAMLLKSLIGSGEFGDIFHIKTSWLSEQSSPEKWFTRKSESGGGVLFDLGVLLIDLALWLSGDKKVEKVYVQKFCNLNESVEDSSVGLVCLEGGSVISFEVSWLLPAQKDSIEITVYGRNGTININPLRAWKKLDSAWIDYSPSGGGSKNLFKKSYENELKHFIGAVRGNNPVISSISEAVDNMKLLEAVYKSAESLTEIKL